jgi:hypothetical protein
MWLTLYRIDIGLVDIPLAPRRETVGLGGFGGTPEEDEDVMVKIAEAWVTGMGRPR